MYQGTDLHIFDLCKLYEDCSQSLVYILAYKWVDFLCSLLCMNILLDHLSPDIGYFDRREMGYTDVLLPVLLVWKYLFFTDTSVYLFKFKSALNKKS